MSEFSTIRVPLSVVLQANGKCVGGAHAEARRSNVRQTVSLAADVAAKLEIPLNSSFEIIEIFQKPFAGLVLLVGQTVSFCNRADCCLFVTPSSH